MSLTPGRGVGGLDTYFGRVVYEQRHINSPKISRKRWLRPDMIEKLLTGTLSVNTNKHTNRTRGDWEVRRLSI